LGSGHTRLALKLKEAFIQKLKQDLEEYDAKLTEQTGKNQRKKAKIQAFK
jgi:hypothetical protein